ncbi:MAG TPA: IclR family transcriptional regulator [Candidatus Binatia bacterium]|nr:IclR family transcriptional regulator [Candidatus Binatia bacterium]
MPRSIQSIERAAQVMRLLSGRTRRLSLMELAGALSLPKGTVFGILRTLQQVGFIEKDPESGKYQLGAALLHLGSTYLDGNELRTRALNWADSLAARSGEAVRIGTLHDGMVLVVHHVFRPDDSYQVLQVGALLPLHATAMGKALLAANPYLLMEVGKQDLEQFTASTIATAADLAGAIAQVKERGWAADIGELVEDEASVAAAITDRRDETVGAISISGPLERICGNGEPRSELVFYVRDSARAISRELGAVPW